MKTRLRAEERRDEIVAAAMVAFAEGGLAGTPTEAIAARAGVSQPYLFQLFGTKKELFLAAVRACFRRTARRFEEVARQASADDVDSIGLLGRMGDAYIRLLLADRDLLRLQLHAYAACADSDIRAVVREEYFALWHEVARIAGVAPETLYPWFAQGMLINTIASIADVSTIDEFTDLLCGGVPRTA